MMKSNRIALLVFATLLLGSTLPLAAAAPPKFRPSGSGDSGTARYVITLSGDAGEEDVAAMKRELPLLYGAALAGNPSSDVRQFTVTMTPARARLLSTDPRVSEVAEAPSVSTPAAPTSTPASPARHFTTQLSGYGDNGQSGTYTYDSSGNITAIGTDTYLYDLEERLSVSVTRGVTETYVYDAFGNRQSAMGAVNCLGQTTCAQPVTLDEHTNRLQTINSAVVQYDTAGNLTTIAGTPSTTYTYDGTGMMIQQTVGSDDRQFVYTADDERIAVRQGLSWTWTVRDPSHKVVREFTSLETPNSGFAMTNRQWLKDYVWRDGLLLATTTSSGTLHYHLDHLGTPRLVTDGSGAKAAEHAYYPFGAEIALAPHETPEEAMKFTGHERDIVAGDGHTLDYMHARYDNTGLGRFLSVDPVLGRPSEPQSWNRYAYAANNPLKNIDPDGRDVWDGLSGFSNSFLSDLGLTIRVEQDNPDYQKGQMNGDRAGVVSGFVIAGTTATAEGTLTIGTGGAGALAIPVAAVGVAYGLGVAGMAAVHLKSDTEPTLPDKKIASGNGVTVEHNYRSGDHPPAHAHVVGGGPETRIGPNGKPLKGNPELTATQRAVVQENKSVIRSTINKIGRWLDFMGF